MVGYYYIYSQLIRAVNRIYISNAAVNSYYQFYFFFREFFNRGFVKTVSVFMSVGNMIFYIFIFDFFEKIVKYNAAWYSVAVIIAINYDFFFFVYCRENSFYGFFHIFHKKRIVDMVVIIWIKKFVSFICRLYTAIKKKLLHKLRIFS